MDDVLNFFGKIVATILLVVWPISIVASYFFLQAITAILLFGWIWTCAGLIVLAFIGAVLAAIWYE
jgi:hypothetical protein